MHRKPSRWNVSPALVMPEAQSLWKGVAFMAPLWCGIGKGVLLNSLGGPLAGANLTAGSTLQWRGTPYGLGAGIAGASNLLTQDNYEPIKTSDGVGTGDLSLLILANPVAEARISVGLCQGASSNSTNLLLGFNTVGSISSATSGAFTFMQRNSNNATNAGVTGALDGKYHVFAGRRRGATVDAFIDGVNRASVTGTAYDIATGVLGFAIGNRSEDTIQRIDAACNIVLAGGWDRALSDAEMRLLARDPFCMFRPQNEWVRMWRPPGGGGGDLNPVDIAHLAGLEAAGFLQAHLLSADEADLAEFFAGAGFSQAHLFAAQEMHSALAFDAAVAGSGAMSVPEFRSAKAGGNLRSRNIASDGASLAVAQDARDRTITE